MTRISSTKQAIVIAVLTAALSGCATNGELETLQALSQLRVGLKVTFEGREEPVLGIVTKINRKSVIVLGDGRKQYKVSPGLLRPLRDVK